MVLTKFQKIRFISFLSFFALISLNLMWHSGFKMGVLLGFLTWSFYVLCIPLSNNAIITTSVLNLFTSNAVRYAKFIPWIVAIFLNIIICIFVPYAYLMSATTFLLYRILSNPWPYWIILITSSLGGIYSVLVARGATRFVLLHGMARVVLFAIGVVTFFYLSYLELVIFFCAQTC
jgi:hypothetical protein